MSDELEMILKEGVVARSRCYPGISLEGLRKTMKTSEQPVLWMKFKPSTYHIKVQGVITRPTFSVPSSVKIRN
jgi:hypothetical protein